MPAPRTLAWLLALALAGCLLAVAAARPDPSAPRRRSLPEPRPELAEVEESPDGIGAAAAASVEPEEAPPSLAGPTTLAGRATGPEGRPVAGLLVKLRGVGRDTSVRARTLTAEDGSFRFEDVPPGRYRLTWGPEGDDLGAAPGVLHLQGGRVLRDLELPALAGLRILVVDRDGVTPWKACRVRLEGLYGRRWWREPDAAGRVEFPWLLPRPWRVVLFEGNRRLAGEQVVLVPGGTSEVVLRRPPEEVPPEPAEEDSRSGRRRRRP